MGSGNFYRGYDLDRGWLEKVGDEEFKKTIVDIMVETRKVHNMQGKNGGGSDAVDVEGTKNDLRDLLEQISKGGDYNHNPLWAAVMQIRAQVIGGRLDLFYTQIISQILWGIKNDADDENKAAFFGKLASRIRGRDVSFNRVVRMGGVFEERTKGQPPKDHYFLGIPSWEIKKQEGVKNTTNPENLPMVLRAYEVMRARAAEGPAKEAVEANIADIKESIAKYFTFTKPIADK